MIFLHVRFWLGLALATVFLGPLATTSEEITDRLKEEAVQAENAFGLERYNQTVHNANALYNLVVVDTGLKRFIDSGYTDDSARGTEELSGRQRRKIASAFNGYLHTLSMVLLGLFYRGAILLQWLVFIGLFLVGAIVDGLVVRRVKVATGGFNSPVKFAWSAHVLVIALAVVFGYLLLPIAVTPWFMPWWTLAIALPLSKTLSNAVRVS